MWDSKRGRLGDSGMAREHVIDLGRRNLFTAAIDQIIFAAANREKTFLINAADVSGFKPTIDKSRGVEFRRIEVTRDDSGSPDENLALCPWGERAPILSGDNNGIRPGQTDRTCLGAARRWLVGRNKRSFAGAVTRQDRNTEGALEAFQHVPRRGRQTHCDKTQRMTGLGVGAGLYSVENQPVERWTGRIPRGFESAKPFRIVKLGSICRKGDGSAGEKRCKNGHFQAVRIKNGAHAETTILGRQIVPGLRYHRSRQHVAVTVRDQLRFGGCTRSLYDEGGSDQSRD